MAVRERGRLIHLDPLIGLAITPSPSSRWLGHKVHAALHVTVDRRLSGAASHAIVERVNQGRAEHVPAFGGADVHVCPGAHPETGSQPTEAAV